MRDFHEASGEQTNAEDKTSTLKKLRCHWCCNFWLSSLSGCVKIHFRGANHRGEEGSKGSCNKTFFFCSDDHGKTGDSAKHGRHACFYKRWKAARASHNIADVVSTAAWPGITGLASAFHNTVSAKPDLRIEIVDKLLKINKTGAEGTILSQIKCVGILVSEDGSI